MVNINNDFYDELGHDWYKSDTHAISLLRCESYRKLDYIYKIFKQYEVSFGSKIIDIACGAGFIANPLAKSGYEVTGIDVSEASLSIARQYANPSALVTYKKQNALDLEEKSNSYDVALLMDCLEHFSNPDQAVKEAHRILRKGGLLIYHTINRTFLAYFLAIKGLEIICRNTPKNLHAYKFFIKPKELSNIFKTFNFSELDRMGINPDWVNRFFWLSIVKRRIHPNFSFKYTKSLAVSYLGTAIKLG